VAYDVNGNSVPADTPVYEAIAGVRGVLVEEATTNLLTANVSTGTDTLGDTTGFTAYNSAALSSSTEQAYQGSRSLKVVTPGAVTTEGANCTYTLANGNPVSGSVMVKAPLGAAMSLQITGSDYTLFTGTGEWQKVSMGVANKTSSANVYIWTTTTPQAITFYVDMLQIEAKAYPTSWTLGSTSRAASTMTIPSNVLNLSEGTIELEVYVNTAFNSSSVTAPRFFDMTVDANNYFIAGRNASAGTYFVQSKGGATAYTIAQVATTLTTGWHQIAISWKPGQKTIMIDGNIATANTDSSNIMPPSTTTLYIMDRATGDRTINTQTRKWHWSRRWKTLAELSQRAATVANGGSYTVTKDTTFYMDSQYDLRAYKIAAGG
jgi:hypothetical protein